MADTRLVHFFLFHHALIANLSNPAVNQLQLERQNERLKEALLKYAHWTFIHWSNLSRRKNFF